MLKIDIEKGDLTPVAQIWAIKKMSISKSRAFSRRVKRESTDSQRHTNRKLQIHWIDLKL